MQSLNWYNIKDTSEAYCSVSVPTSGRTKCQF